MASTDTSLIDELKQRAETAKKEIKLLKERLRSLESESIINDDVESKESKSNLILGAPSSMGDDYQLNLRHLCERGVKIQPNSEIVTRIDNGKYHRITYKEIQKKAVRLALALDKFGIKIGDRVGTFMWNNSRHLCLYYAVPSMGAVLHTLNIRLSNKELSYIINHASDSIIFVDATLLQKFQQIDIKTINKLKKIVICGKNEKPGNWTTTLSNTIDFDEFLKYGQVDQVDQVDTFNWPDLHERSGAVLCYTSGTTGNPKGVMYSHRSLYLEILYFMTTDVMNISGSDCILPIVPMFHALAWFTPYMAFCLGFKYVLYNNCRSPVDFLDMICNEEVNLLLGVPTILNGIKLILETNEDVFSKYADKLKSVWSRAGCGGSQPSSSMIKWYWNELNVEIIHGWGMTECGLSSVSRRVRRRCDLTKTDQEKYENQLPQGFISPLVEAKLVEPDNYSKELKFNGNDIGELLIRGPVVATQYYRNDTKQKFNDGWLITGDIVSIQSNYLLSIKDRSKDLIKSGGEWISSALLENEISAMNGIDKCCVIGAKHPKFQERPIVIIEMKNKCQDEKPTLNEIKEFLMKTQKFAKFQLPDDVIFDQIPLTGTGKMNKKQCREQLEKQNYVLPQLRDC